jgi:hypothetical protein
MTPQALQILSKEYFKDLTLIPQEVEPLAAFAHSSKKFSDD